MAIVGGMDIHRSQITFDYLDTESGSVSRGEVKPATRNTLRKWLQRFHGQEVAFALEATTGWRYVVEELVAAGVEPHLAEPADTRALRGTKMRAKTDRQDAQHLRQLLQTGKLPESWIPPQHIQELRSLVRLRKTLLDERSSWQRRIHAQLFQHGQPGRPRLLTEDSRAWLETLEVSPASKEVVGVALRMIDQINEELDPIERQLVQLSNRLLGCRALKRIYGIGAFTAVAVLSELGDVRRFSSSRKALRHSGLDVTVYESAGKRARGHLSRQGPPVLRWALYEAAICAARPTSPDLPTFMELQARLGRNRARLTITRKLLRRAYHSLRELGDQALLEAS